MYLDGEVSVTIDGRPAGAVGSVNWESMHTNSRAMAAILSALMQLRCHAHQLCLGHSRWELIASFGGSCGRPLLSTDPARECSLRRTHVSGIWSRTRTAPPRTKKQKHKHSISYLYCIVPTSMRLPLQTRQPSQGPSGRAVIIRGPVGIKKDCHKEGPWNTTNHLGCNHFLLQNCNL